MGPDRWDRAPAQVGAESKVAEAGAAVTALDQVVPLFVQAAAKRPRTSWALPVSR